MKIKEILITISLLAVLFSEGFSQRRLNEPERTVLKFYQWYLKDVYCKKSVESPKVKLTRDSVYQIDATKHIQFLDESGYFSSQFYQNELPMFAACNAELKKINPKLVIEGSPADFVRGNACEFLQYKVWTGGQGEYLNTVHILKSMVTRDSANVVAVIGDSSGYKYSFPTVTLLNEDGKWKISRIQLSYHEPK